METKAEDSRILLTMAVDYVYLAKKKKGTGEEEGGYGKDKDGAPVLAEVSVAASPLATVTIVLQCGSEVRLRMEALSSTLWSQRPPGFSLVG